MPFKDLSEGQTHYYGDGCKKHPICKENWETKARELLDEHFPELNKPNSNNRATALMLYAELLFLFRLELEKTQKELKRAKDAINDR